MSHYAEYCVVSLADGADALCRHNGHCVAAFPPSFDSPERSGYRRGNTPLHSLSLISLRSGATVCPPAPSLDAREIEPGSWRSSTAYRFRRFAPAPSPILQAAPHLNGGGPSPRLPARLAPRFRSLTRSSARALRALAERRPSADSVKPFPISRATPPRVGGSAATRLRAFFVRPIRPGPRLYG